MPEIAHTKRFVLHLADGNRIDGIEFPSGRIICDSTDDGLFAATSIEELRLPVVVERVERLVEAAEHVIGDDGQTCRTTALLDAAEILRRDLFPAVYDDAGQKAAEGVNRAAQELRRLAGAEEDDRG